MALSHFSFIARKMQMKHLDALNDQSKFLLVPTNRKKEMLGEDDVIESNMEYWRKSNTHSYSIKNRSYNQEDDKSIANLIKNM